MSGAKRQCKCERIENGKKVCNDSAGDLSDENCDVSALALACRRSSSNSLGAIGPTGYAKLQKSAALTAFHAGLTVLGPFRTIPRIDQRSFAGGKMSKIRHLAIKTKDPARLAKFYEEVFGLKVIHTERSGAVYMSDGYL